MPATDPRVRIGDNDANGLTADVLTTDPASDSPALAVRIAGTLPASALPAGAATAAAQTDGSQRAGVLGVNGTTIASTSNPVPTVSRADDARTELRASTILTTSYVASSTYTIPAGVKWVTFVLTYTRGGAAGSAAHQIEIGDGTDIGPAVLLGGTITVTAPNGARPAYLDEINPGPVPADASALVYAIQWQVGGESTIRIKSKEVGNGAAPGTLQVAIKGKY